MWRSAIYEPMLAALPDVQVTVEEVIADEQRAVVRWRFRGTHAGAGLGIPPTAARSRWSGMTWLRFDSGCIVEAGTAGTRTPPEAALVA